MNAYEKWRRNSREAWAWREGAWDTLQAVTSDLRRQGKLSDEEVGSLSADLRDRVEETYAMKLAKHPYPMTEVPDGEETVTIGGDG